MSVLFTACVGNSFELTFDWGGDGPTIDLSGYTPQLTDLSPELEGFVTFTIEDAAAGSVKIAFKAIYDIKPGTPDIGFIPTVVPVTGVDDALSLPRFLVNFE